MLNYKVCSKKVGFKILRITEIFFSLQGESLTVGQPTVFIRLTGCPLRCVYCDTAYAFHGGKKLSIDDILSEVAKIGIESGYVTVTGGEPLAQPGCKDLLSKLCDLNYKVSLETSGAISLENVDPRVMKVMDLKTPASKEDKKNKYENLKFLNKNDQIKIVICNRDDYEWAKNLVKQKELDKYCEVLFSPEHTGLNPTDLANWIIEDKLAIRFQFQLHKFLWGDLKGK